MNAGSYLWKIERKDQQTSYLVAYIDQGLPDLPLLEDIYDAYLKSAAIANVGIDSNNLFDSTTSLQTHLGKTLYNQLVDQLYPYYLQRYKRFKTEQYLNKQFHLLRDKKRREIGGLVRKLQRIDFIRGIIEAIIGEELYIKLFGSTDFQTIDHFNKLNAEQSVRIKLHEILINLILATKLDIDIEEPNKKHKQELYQYLDDISIIEATMLTMIATKYYNPKRPYEIFWFI